MRPLVLVLWLCLLAGAATAVEPDEILSDPALEARARAISAEVRCVVCQNESIDSSNAGIARELRRIIRERLLAGDSDAEIYDFLVARYGDFVLLNPPMKPETWALWFGPAAVLAAGGLVLVLALRRRRRQAAEPPPLTEAERRRLQSLLEEGRRQP